MAGTVVVWALNPHDGLSGLCINNQGQMITGIPNGPCCSQSGQRHMIANLVYPITVFLRTETGAASWRVPQEYEALDGLLAGEIGKWEGGIFIETPRCGNAQSGSGAGGTQTRVFNSYVVGQEALAEAVAEEPHVVLDGVIVDPLKRKTAMGWYGILGWNRFRPESLWRIESTSSIHNQA